MSPHPFQLFSLDPFNLYFHPLKPLKPTLLKVTMTSTWPNSMVNFQSLFRCSAAWTLWLTPHTHCWHIPDILGECDCFLSGERSSAQGRVRTNYGDNKVNQIHSIKRFFFVVKFVNNLCVFDIFITCNVQMNVLLWRTICCIKRLTKISL